MRLHAFDLGVVGLYLIAITLFGLRFARKGTAKDRSLRGYFLADRTIPWWAIALSIVSAETSTLTIIGTPGLAFAGDFGFLQIVIGYMLGRIVVALLFLPRYFQGEMLTAYQLIDRRFGRTLYKVTSGLFLLTRAAAEGVRVFAVSIVVALAIGTGDVLSIAIISALTLLYTFEGGMAAVIWTDVVQMAIYVGGTMVAIWSIGQHIPGGWSHIHTVASAAGKFHMLNFALNLTTTYTFWAGVLGGTFLTMASHGTDQLMVQRMLAAKNLRQSQLAVLSSGVVIFVQFTLFLLIGAGLFVFYGMHPAALTALHGSDTNRIFPAFIVREMPTGVAGLLVAAILAAAMSNLSAALNSLSSATVVDFYMGFRPAADDRERMIVSRASTILWALVLFAVAVYAVHAGGKGNVVELGLSIASVAYGCLLGVFLLGTLTRYATQWGAIIGMITGFALNVALWLQPAAVRIGGVTVPKIAWTWYVLIGALVTFAIGSLASAALPRPRARKAVTATTLFLITTLFLLSSRSEAQGSAGSAQPAAYDFSAASAAIDTAIAQHKLPGAVLVVGHSGKVVFEHAYGVRKYAGEPGLDGKPSPAEPMTEDTIFDMASLTKCLVTATAIMQLYEAHKLDLDAPVAKYLPEFAANGKQNVTIRELLTHYSGLPPDVDLTDPWGLAAPDKAEGIRRALASPLTTTPGTHFEYSDINFITLGALVEKLSGEDLDIYAQQHIFSPLRMTHTRFLPLQKACRGKDEVTGSAIGPIDTHGIAIMSCLGDSWLTDDRVPNIAPTAHDDQGTPATNPDFDHLLRGTVHDPTTRRMGGVAGQAGVFSTAADISLYAQALLDKLLYNRGPFPLQQSTLRLMTTPEQPATALPGATIFTQDGKTTTGIALHGLGWDINTAYSRPRGSVFPTVTSPADKTIPSFGHTGFTGTSLWIDPTSDTYVILLANSIHPRGAASISPLRGEVATAVAKAIANAEVLNGNCTSPGDENLSHADCSVAHSDSSVDHSPSSFVNLSVAKNPGSSPGAPPPSPELKGTASAVPQNSAQERTASAAEVTSPGPSNAELTLTGLDVLESTHFAALRTVAAQHAGHLRIGLLTNQTGVDSAGYRTIDILRSEEARAAGIELTTLFSPEHGIFGAKDSEHIGPETDPTTGLKVISLYGPRDSDKRPHPEDLKNLDAVVIDIQDAGVRFYTYETVLGYFLEAAACETAHAHPLEIIVLDRPSLIGGLSVQGPVSDTAPSYINYMPEPVRNDMTLGELAQYMRTEHPGSCAATPAHLTVIPLQNWHRSEFFDETGLPWINPSPNLRSVAAATLYPGLGMLDYTNVSVGRGTSTPFEVFGAGTSPGQAAWFDAATVAAYLTARHIPGLTFTPTAIPVADTPEKYPYHGQIIQGVRLNLTDRTMLDSPELGIEILSALHHLYPAQFTLEKATGLVANSETMAALARGADPRDIALAWQPALTAFNARRARYLLYP